MTATNASSLSLDDDLRSLFGCSPEALQNPYPLYDRLRVDAPVHRFGNLVVLSSYAGVKDVLLDPKHFPQTPERGIGFDEEELLALLNEEERGLYRRLTAFDRTFMSHVDGQDHRRLRDAAKRAFTSRRVAALRRSIEELADELLDERVQPDGAIDLIEFAYRLPLLVIMDMLGAPRDDADMVKAWGDSVLESQAMSPIPAATLRGAWTGLEDYRAYVEELIALHQSSPGLTDLVADLLEARAEGRLSYEELIGTVVLLLFAGHETTMNLIGNGVRALLTAPEQWRKLCADPDGAAARAVEEALRYDPPVQFFGKRAGADAVVSGTAIRAGTAVVISLAAANHDPSQFHSPQIFDMNRNPNDHLSFGHGIHFCLGAPVARLEGEIAFAVLARRFPKLRLAIAPDELRIKPHANLRGLEALPLLTG
jgi:cytochrome P450